MKVQHSSDPWLTFNYYKLLLSRFNPSYIDMLGMYEEFSTCLLLYTIVLVKLMIVQYSYDAKSSLNRYK